MPATTRVSARLREKRSSQREDEDIDTSNGDEETNNKATILVESNVRKLFEGHGWFRGQVLFYDEDRKLFKVRYEDEDEEELNYSQLQKILLRDDEMEFSEDEEENEAKKPVAEEEAYSNEGEDDDDDCMLVVDDAIDNEESAVNVSPATSAAVSPTKSTPRKAKIPALAVTPSPSSKQKLKSKTPASTTKKKATTKRKASPKGGDRIANNNPRSIAAFGLPRGALAKCSKSGLTIRSLDGILPLRGPSASFLHHSIHQTNQSSLKQEPEFTATPVYSRPVLLPGRILVVALDSQGICPPNFVGQTFASSTAFHDNLSKTATNAVSLQSSDSSLSSSLQDATISIDYDMEVVADPVFAPWEFVHARLASSGLLDINDDDDEEEEEGVATSRGPLLYVVQIQWNGDSKVTGSVSWYAAPETEAATQKHDYQWAIIENDQRENPSVLLGVSQSLLVQSEIDEVQEMKLNGNYDTATGEYDEDLLPLPTAKIAQIRLPSSLLEKSIRRGKGLCSAAPLLEASARLLLARNKIDNDNGKVKLPLPGSTLAMLKTVWGCMLVDASPFDDADGRLGLPGFLLLSLVAKADPSWTMPAALRRAAVAGALRTAQSAPSRPWLGFVERSDDWWELGKNASRAANPATANSSIGAALADQKAFNLRSILRATQAVVGGRLAWGKWNKFIGDASAAAALSYLNSDGWDGAYLPASPSSSADEVAMLFRWEEGRSPGLPTEPLLRHLDKECRLAAVEPAVMPSTLILLQAVLSLPPNNWKKYSLPSLARQVRKLISEANSRVKERVQLARLATWGKEKAATNPMASFSGLVGLAERGAPPATPIALAQYKSFREVVTPTGTLSEKEIEVVDCFGAIQKYLSDHLQQDPILTDRIEGESMTSSTPIESSPAEANASHFTKVKAGPMLSAFDGRTAFILAFASAIEVEICPNPQLPSSKEVVSAMFCGSVEEPLLIQRIGRARREGKEAATAGGPTSGATAVPSLGYVQRSRSQEEANMVKAAEKAVAKHWIGGKTAPLPLPPAGMQWDLHGDKESVNLGWDEKETDVERTAELVDDGDGKERWRFTIAGKDVALFDARAVVSPCALNLDDEYHRPTNFEPASRRLRCLKLALYVKDESANGNLPHGGTILEAMKCLHALAKADREITPHTRLSDGRVYNWMPLACSSLIPSRTWRDALLAVRTRENDHVILGRGIQPDGNGTTRDMVEGVLLRLFHALEMLYPQALRKEGALKFRVRPRGAAYYHLLACLERLGRGEGLVGFPIKNPAKQEAGAKQKKMDVSIVINQGEVARPSKRPRRAAAVAASNKVKMAVTDEIRTSESKTAKADICDSDLSDGDGDQEFLPLPKIKTTLWMHQEASVAKVVEGVREGRRGHADASAVGAGKTLTALATIVRLAHWIEETGRKRHGTLVMLPTKALIREWLLEIAAHTQGFHLIEQREDGSLFSLTYGKTHPPIDGNCLIISTLDRVCSHPFVRQSAWDFVVIDECLAVQNATAKRNPSAWRQIEVSMCGVLCLSATFFRSKYDQLFYMIRMLRSPLPRTMEWLPATIHEHIVCQIPETDRTWKMEGEMVPLPPKELPRYRNIIEAWRRKQINNPGEADGRKLWIDLECFLRSEYEGRDTRASYRQVSAMSDAFAKVAKRLLRKGRRPLIFADTSQEADFLLRTLGSQGLDACSWASVASEQIATSSTSHRNPKNSVIVALKTTEGQGINMQRHADCIICRPTPGDHLEQMKGRVDRPGQTTKELLLVVLVAEHTIEEAKFANIRLAGNFFREYIAPVATKYKERIDLEATLAAGGTGKLKTGTVSGAWKRSLEVAGQSGSFVDFDDTASTCTSANKSGSFGDDILDDDFAMEKKSSVAKKERKEPKHKPLNKVIRNKGDPKAVRYAKQLAKDGQASLAVRHWLFPPKIKGTRLKGLPKESLQRFSATTPPVVLDRATIFKAVTHLSNSDPKLASLIARVGAEALALDCGGDPKPPTQARLFDRCVRSITFTMVSVDAGNAFLRRLAMKIGACLERQAPAIRKELLQDLFQDAGSVGGVDNANSPETLLQLLLDGMHSSLTFTHQIVRSLITDCEIVKGKQTGYPHLCGVTFPCGKNDDHGLFLEKARAHAGGEGNPVSAGFSNPKASFIISLVEDFECGKISGEKIAKASDREAARMLMELKGIGDWCAGGVLMHFLSRADIMLYGDLTVRNYLNDLYDINHHDASETLIESAADFADTGANRNLIDAVAAEKRWGPYRSIVCYLCYHLQEENLVLL